MKRLLFLLAFFTTIYGSVIEVKSMAELAEQIENSTGKVYVDCYSKKCPPCRILTPLFEEWSKQKNVQDVFIKVDISQVSDFALKYNVSMVPTVLIFDKKKSEPKKKTGLNQITSFFNLICQNQE